jgi:hypothetical protein
LLTTRLDELPVLRSGSILEVFRAQKGRDLWVNKIVELVNKETGSKDKPAIIKTIEYLEQAAILDSQLVNKQKTIKKLSPLGHEILDLKCDLDDWQRNYIKLKDLIIHYNFKVGVGKTKRDIQMRNKILKNKLLNFGFSKDEIESFDDMIKSAFEIESLYRTNIFTCILHRYSNILSRHNPNDKATKILFNMMTKAILRIFSLTKELNSVFDDPEFYLGSGQMLDRGDLLVDLAPYRNIDASVLDDIEEMGHDFGIFLNRKELADIAHDLTLSTLMVLQPDKENILGQLPDEEEMQERKETERQLGHSLVREEYFFDDFTVEQIYEEYLQEMKVQGNSEIN